MVTVALRQGGWRNNVTLKNPIRRIESTGIIGDNVIYRLIVLTEGATDTAAGTPVARMEY